MIARSIRSKMACCACQASSVMPLRSLRSPPAQNALSPLPVRITARNPSRSIDSPSKSSIRSSPMRVFMALDTSGRLSVTSRIWSPCRSMTIVANSARMAISFPAGLEEGIVLAKLWRNRPCARPGAIECERDDHQFDTVAVATDRHVECPGLRMFGDLVDGQERRIRDAGRVERPTERIGCMQPDGLGDLRDQPVTMDDAPCVGCVIGIPRQRVQSHRAAKLAEQIVKLCGAMGLDALARD